MRAPVVTAAEEAAERWVSWSLLITFASSPQLKCVELRLLEDTDAVSASSQLSSSALLCAGDNTSFCELFQKVCG